MRINVYNVSRPSANLLPLDTDCFNHAFSSQIIENPSHTMFITKTTFLVCGEKKKNDKNIYYLRYAAVHDTYSGLFTNTTPANKNKTHTPLLLHCVHTYGFLRVINSTRLAF